jgi:hypothetical protein
MIFKKYVSIEKTFSKREIEEILRKHIEKELDSQDVDFRGARWLQDDYTYSFKDGAPYIEVVILIDDVKLRRK